MDILQTRRVEIIKIVPSKDRAPEYVRVRDETDEPHLFISGSLNGIPAKWRKVGTKGVINYVKEPTRALWHFVADESR